MRTAIFILLVSSFNFAHAEDVKERVIAEIPKGSGTIRKIQIDLLNEKDGWQVQTKSLNDKGKKLQARLSCRKVSNEEFECQRDDNGGGFNLLLGASPKVTFTYFTADVEGEDTVNEIKSKKGEKLVVNAKKTTISTKDAF